MTDSKLIFIDKPEGLTPLQALDSLKLVKPELAASKLGYIGRLDPMASGVLPVMINDANQQIITFKGLDKTYQFKIMLGALTDTYDILGLPTIKNSPQPISLADLKKAGKNFTGQITQPYPPYSSAKVGGKPLFYWARQGKLDEIQIPSKTVTVHSLSFSSPKTFSSSELLTQVTHRVSKVIGDFRQPKIIRSWKLQLSQSPNQTFQVFQGEAKVSSGTYIRGICHSIGTVLGTSALAYSIHRTYVGAHGIDQCLSINKNNNH